MAGGAVGVLVAWRLVAAGRATVWTAMASVLGVAGALSLATGRISLSQEMAAGWSALAGVGSGVLLYAGTATFVLAVRRWSVFERHVAEIYDQRRGLALRVALALAALTAVGEELFWRGLFQGELAEASGPLAGTLLTWMAYVAANAVSGSLPIAAGAVVGGAAWGALAWWTGGVLASVACHLSWTALMLVLPPGGPAEAGSE
jgi:membrane protease YdiL (CAAX protease family)